MGLLKVLNGRIATEADVDAHSVVFYIPDGRSVPYTFEHELPLLARVTKTEDEVNFAPPGTLVTIVQAELVDGQNVVLGLMMDGDVEGICDLADVDVLGPALA